MKPDIHPEYRFVVFRDVSCDFEFMTRSTIEARDTTTIDGVEYPLVKLDISSQSHPFYTGNQKILDTAGRVEKFYKKYGFQVDEQEVKTDEGEAIEEPRTTAGGQTPAEATAAASAVIDAAESDATGDEAGEE